MNCLMDEMNYMHESHLTNETGHKHNVNKYEIKSHQVIIYGQICVHKNEVN